TEARLARGADGKRKIGRRNEPEKSESRKNNPGKNGRRKSRAGRSKVGPCLTDAAQEDTPGETFVDRRYARSPNGCFRRLTRQAGQVVSPKPPIRLILNHVCRIWHCSRLSLNGVEVKTEPRELSICKNVA